MDPNMPTGDTMDEGDYSGAEEQSERNITLDASMFGGIPAEEGSKVRFCVTGKGEDGTVTGYFESDQDETEPERGDESKAKFERDFTNSMRAASKTEPM